MNYYTDYKVFIFGTLIRQGHEDILPFIGTWNDLLKNEEFTEFRKKHEITEQQLILIKRGFDGPAIDTELEEDVPVHQPEELFPFGTHAGKEMSQVPIPYYAFLLRQPWINKWPNVKEYAEHAIKDANKDAASIDEVKTILQKIQ